VNGARIEGANLEGATICHLDAGWLGQSVSVKGTPSMVRWEKEDHAAEQKNCR